MLASRVHVPKMARKRSRRVTVRSALTGMRHPSKSTDGVHAVPESH